MPSWTDFLSPAIVIAVVVLLWRDTAGRIARLGRTVATLAETVANVDRRLAAKPAWLRIPDVVRSPAQFRPVFRFGGAGPREAEG